MAGPQASSCALSISTRNAISAVVDLRANGAAGARSRLTKGIAARRLPRHRLTSRVRCARLQPRGLLQIAAQDATPLLGTPRIVKPLEYPAALRVTLRVFADRRRLDRRAAPEKILDLLNRAQSRFVHVDQHPLDDQPVSRHTSFFRPQAHTRLEIRRHVQAHTTLDKALV